MLHTIDKVEIMATGTWQNMVFNEKEIDGLVAAFGLTKEEYQAPLKLGHNDQQALADGALSFGWVESLWKESGADGGVKLMAKFTDVPKIVYEAIKNKLFKKVSVEMFKNVSFDNKQFDYVLSGVAILGSTLPEVTTLADISHYFKRNGFGSSELLCFSALDQNGNLIKETEMSITKEAMEKALADQKAEMELQFSKKNTDTKTADELALAQSEIVEFKRKEKEASDKLAADKVEFARKTVNELLDKSVKDMVITPVQKESFSKVLGVDKDSVVDIDLEDVKALIGEKASFSKAKDEKTKGDSEMTAGEELHFKAKEYMDDHEKVSYTRALEVAMEKNPELAKEHLNATVGEE